MKKNKLLIIITIILLVTNYLTFSAIDRLENRISNLNSSVNRINDRMEGISGDVARKLNEFTTENSWTRKTCLKPGHYNEETMKVTVDVEVEFNELRNDEKVYIFIQNLNDNHHNKVDVTATMDNTLNLKYSLDLNIDNDYDLYIIGESSKLKRSESLGGIYLKSRIEKPINVDNFQMDIKSDEKKIYKSINTDIMIHTAFEKEDFVADYFKNRKIVDIQGEVYVDDVIFDYIDILDDKDWSFYDIETGSRNEREEVSSKEEDNVPVFELDVLSKGSSSERMFNLSGTYTFKKTVNSKQKVQMFIIFKDNMGDEYRYLTNDSFDQD